MTSYQCAPASETTELKSILARMLAFDGSMSVYSSSEMIRAREDAAKHVTEKDVAEAQRAYFDKIAARAT